MHESSELTLRLCDDPSFASRMKALSIGCYSCNCSLGHPVPTGKLPLMLQKS